MKHYFTCDAEGQLDKVFFECAGGFEDWALTPKTNVLLFDPTHGTNRYSMKLCMFVSVHPHGHSVVLAGCLIASECTDAFTWCFTCFHKTFKTPPRTFFTDSDGAIEAAFQAVQLDFWSGVMHLYCIFHLSKNFWDHIHPLFIGRPAEWKKVHDWFWRLAKETDTESQGQLNCDWEELTQFVANECASLEEKRVEKAVEWLDGLLRRSSQWAYRYTWRYCAWGVNSTQRSEGINSTVKKYLNASTLLVDLVSKVDGWNDLTRHGQEVKSIRLHFRQAESTAVLPPFITRLRGKITPFAYEMLVAQAVQSLQYNADKQSNGKYTVRRIHTERPSGLTYAEDGNVVSYACPAD